MSGADRYSRVLRDRTLVLAGDLYAKLASQASAAGWTNVQAYLHVVLQQHLDGRCDRTDAVERTRKVGGAFSPERSQPVPGAASVPHTTNE